MIRPPRWCRWLFGSVGVVSAVGLALLVPAIRDARNAAKKSQDK